MIYIDLGDTYDLKKIVKEGESLVVLFHSVSPGGEPILIKVRISQHLDPLLPMVWNLAFGPPDEHGAIDDKVKIKHKSQSKLFSTILMVGLSYLDDNPDQILGIDGSNDARAYLYHRMLIRNRKTLEEHFSFSGVDWYVRLLRNATVECTADGKPLFKPRPEVFDYSRPCIDLYRYYLMGKKK